MSFGDEMHTDLYGHMVNRWCEQNVDDWQNYTRHRYVEKLADGSLPQHCFLHYLKQDYIFLIHFARAWALAVVKSQDITEMRLCAGTVHALIDEEMRLHIGTCAAYGISEADLAALREEPANLAYTRFVTDTGLRGDLLDLLAALAPCVFGYGDIGARLIKGIDKSHPYHDWIATYGGEDYQDVCRSVAVLIDKVATTRLGGVSGDLPRLEELSATFATACRLEVDFWQMGLDAPR